LYHSKGLGDQGFMMQLCTTSVLPLPNNPQLSKKNNIKIAIKTNAELEKQFLHTRLPFLMSLYTRMTTLCPSTMLAREYNFLSSCASGILKHSTLHPVYTIMGYPLPPRSTQHPCIYTNIHQCVFTNNLHCFSFGPSVLVKRRVRVELQMKPSLLSSK
jgi:hypothetical protein